MAFVKATKTQAKGRLALIGPPGAGKAQPLYCKVLTPSGWREMGSLSIGDDVVRPDGGSAKITAIHPQGVKPIFRVTFSDGVSTECCDDHLWLTTTHLDRGSPLASRQAGKVRSLKEIRNSILRNDGSPNHQIPMVSSLQFRKQELPIDPYLMGALLGNGCFQSKCVLFSSADKEIQNAVAERLPAGVMLSPERKPDDGINFRLKRIAPSGEHPLLTLLRKIGFTHTGTRDKFIPPEYLLGTTEDRISLLQGLMDTDGYTSGCKLEFGTSSVHLRDGFVSLVQSLGGVATWISRQGDTGESYRVFPSLPAHVMPFRLPRKANRNIPKTRYRPRRSIISIEPVGNHDAQCIAIDSPDHLYVTDDYIVTHNTWTALLVAEQLGKKIAVIDTENASASKYADRFTFDTEVLTSVDPRKYVEAIQAAESAGYDVLIIDSLSHAWAGKDGLLNFVDKVTARSKSGNAFTTGWREATLVHNQLVDALVQCKCHLIVTMRCKTDWVIEEGPNGKKSPKKIGLAPVQREGLEYEFDVVGDIDGEHKLIISKSRCPALADAVIDRPDGKNLGRPFADWLSTGIAPPAVEVDGERATVLEEIVAALNTRFANDKEAAKKAVEQAFGTSKWSNIKSLPMPELREGTGKIKVICLPPEEDAIPETNEAAA
jgi:hypothetical protein